MKTTKAQANPRYYIIEISEDPGGLDRHGFLTVRAGRAGDPLFNLVSTKPAAQKYECCAIANMVGEHYCRYYAKGPASYEVNTVKRRGIK